MIMIMMLIVTVDGGHGVGAGVKAKISETQVFFFKIILGFYFERLYRMLWRISH